MGLMLDSGVFIIYLERRAETFDPERIEGQRPFVVSAMTISELFVGAMRADSDARRSQRTAYVEDVISKLAVLPFTAVTARLHAGLHADLPTRGQLIGAHDLIIAATALEHGHSVLTTNRREFDRVDGLDVIDFPFPA